MCVTARSVISLLLTVMPLAAQANLPQAAPTLDEINKALGETVTVTSSVTAIDYEARVVVFCDAQKNERSLYVGEDVKKLQGVKVGDTVNRFPTRCRPATRILKPGEPAPKTGTTDSVVGTAAGVQAGQDHTVQNGGSSWWTPLTETADVDGSRREGTHVHRESRRRSAGWPNSGRGPRRDHVDGGSTRER